MELEDNHRLVGERLAALLPGARNRFRDGCPATGRERAIHQTAALGALTDDYLATLSEPARTEIHRRIGR